MSYQRKRAVSVNDRGHVIGEDHHRSRFSNHEIDLARDLRADGMSYAEIAGKFDVHRRTVEKWCTGRLRGHLAVDQKLLAPPRTRYRTRRPARPSDFDLD